MFITDYNICKSGNLIGVLKLEKTGFSLPNRPDLLEPIRKLAMKGHRVEVQELRETAIVHIVPNDLTRDMVLNAIRLRLRYTGFVLSPRQ